MFGGWGVEILMLEIAKVSFIALVAETLGMFIQFSLVISIVLQVCYVNFCRVYETKS